MFCRRDSLRGPRAYHGDSRAHQGRRCRGNGQSILAGGLLGLYLLGFLTTRGDGRAVGVGIAFAVGFSTLMSFAGLGWLPAGLARWIESQFDAYYTGLVSNLVMFGVGFVLAALLPTRPRDLRNLTVWTRESGPGP